MTTADAKPWGRGWGDRSPVALPDLAFEHILRAILRGDFSPGDTLSTAQFAQELRMSLNPIREAIIRLRDIGLVEVTPSRYTRLTHLTDAETRAAVDYAGVLAGAALRHALPTAQGEARTDLAARAEAIGAADGAAARIASVVAFLSGVADLLDHPRQSTDLVEATILAQYALQLAEVDSDGDPGRALADASEELLRALRSADPEAAERGVRTLFAHLMQSMASPSTSVPTPHPEQELAVPHRR